MKAYADYCETGLTWWPQAPAHWSLQRLRFVARVNPGRQTAGLSDDTEVSFVPMEAIGERGSLDLASSRPLGDLTTGYTPFANGDVVLAKITPCFENGKGALMDGLSYGVGFGTTELHVVRPGPEVDGRYLFYLTQSHPFRSLGAGEMYGAGGQKRVPEDFVRNFRAAWPPLAEQRAIGAFLDTRTTALDRLTAAKEGLLAVMDRKRHTLIATAVTRGIDADVCMQESRVSFLGRIPAHWRVQRLKFVLLGIEQGWSPQCENRVPDDDEWGVLKVGCVNGWAFDPNESKALPAHLEPAPEYEVRRGDVLMSRANTRELVGSAALVTDVRGRLLLCDKLYRLRYSPATFDGEYLTLFLRSIVAREQMEAEATGASGSMQNIGQDTVKNLLLPVPPVAEQTRIVDRIRQQLAGVSDAQAALTRQIDSLQSHRLALITEAVTGQFDVRSSAGSDQ